MVERALHGASDGATLRQPDCGVPRRLASDDLNNEVRLIKEVCAWRREAGSRSRRPKWRKSATLCSRATGNGSRMRYRPPQPRLTTSTAMLTRACPGVDRARERSAARATASVRSASARASTARLVGRREACIPPLHADPSGAL